MPSGAAITVVSGEAPWQPNRVSCSEHAGQFVLNIGASDAWVARMVELYGLGE